MREILIDLARMYDASLAHKLQQSERTFSPRSWPRQPVLGGHAAIRPRMHQCLQLTRHEPIIDEEVFFDAEPNVSALQITCAVILDPMPQDQVLRSSRRANRVRLNKLHS